MDAVIPLEPQLNAIIVEYLEFFGYNQTKDQLYKELKLFGKHQEDEAIPLRNDSQITQIQENLLSAFDGGSYENFFVLWNQHIPSNVQTNDGTCQKLEFNLRIYFAVYPITNGRQNKSLLEKSMKMFKTYLESKGAGLSQTTEFLPYYALPFVPDPTMHPSFKPIFSNSWSIDLRGKLEKYLLFVLKSQEKPKLYILFKNGPDIVEKERKRHSEQVKLLQHQLSELEKRSSQYFKRFSKVQNDYHRLIGIAAELVDSLEDCVRGKMVTPEYLQDICLRLFSNSMQDSIDVSKPGTASSMLRASIALIPESVSVGNESPTIMSLDYDKIKKDLMLLSDRPLIFLLQALRWRLTNAPNTEKRDASITAFIIHDLVGLSMEDKEDGILGLLIHSNDVVRQYMARLLNSIGSFSAGRTYFAGSTLVLQALYTSLMTEPRTSLTSENVLGTLQKLSLRRKLQSIMIEKDLIQWLVTLLGDHDSLTDYTLEYSVALLMNLSLRSSGKRKCIHNSSHVLKVLSDLLGHENQEIRPYINGALYSILALPAIKEEARAMGMESILECFLNDENADMQRQIQFIIKQLNTENPLATNDPYSDDEDEADDDDEEDAIDIDHSKLELIQPLSGELSGEDLLSSEYASGRSSQKPQKIKNRLTSDLGPDHPLTRPTTPGFKPSDSIQSLSGVESRPGTTTLQPHKIQSTSNDLRPSSTPKSSYNQMCPTQSNDDTNSQRRHGQSNKNGPSLKDPFASRPKIPRDMDEPQARGTASSTPPLARSMSPTRSISSTNRPGSGH